MVMVVIMCVFVGFRPSSLPMATWRRRSHRTTWGGQTGGGSMLSGRCVAPEREKKGVGCCVYICTLQCCTHYRHTTHSTGEVTVHIHVHTLNVYYIRTYFCMLSCRAYIVIYTLTFTYLFTVTYINIVYVHTHTHTHTHFRAHNAAEAH